MNFRHCLILVCLCLTVYVLPAQQAGQSVFQSLLLAPSARTLALGGRIVSMQDSDVVLSLINPAIASVSGTHQLAINQSYYYTGSSYSTLAVAHQLVKQQLILTAGVQYLKHGDLTGADEFGNKTGTFTAGEYAIVLGASKKLFAPLSIGIHLKYLSSRIEAYNSHGLAIDLGAIYALPSGRESIGLTVQNIGSQWNYYQDDKEPMPFNILIGYSQRLKYVPFVFTVTGQHLQGWNLRQEKVETTDPIFGEPAPSPSVFSKTIDNLARHLIISGEIYLGKYAPIRLRISYNHHRRQELKDQNYGGLSGFSGGLGIKVSRLIVDYGLAQYHLAGSIHAVGVSYRWK